MNFSLNIFFRNLGTRRTGHGLILDLMMNFCAKPERTISLSVLVWLTVACWHGRHGTRRDKKDSRVWAWRSIGVQIAACSYST